MSDTANETAALDWADRMDRGEIQFDPYLTSLAKRVRDLTAENERLRAALGVTSGVGNQMTELVDALAAAKARIIALEELLAWFVELDHSAAVHMTWNDDGYWALPAAVAQALSRRLASARGMLDGNSDA